MALGYEKLKVPFSIPRDWMYIRSYLLCLITHLLYRRIIAKRDNLHTRSMQSEDQRYVLPVCAQVASFSGAYIIVNRTG